MTHANRTFLAALAALAALVAVVAASAHAAPRVFHSPSDDGAEPVGVPQLPTDDDTLFLYVVGEGGASMSGVPCATGDGGELCGWDVVVHPGPNAELGAFTPEPDVTFSADAGELRANGIDVSPAGVAPVRIGSLRVFTLDPSQPATVYVDGLQVVTASLAVAPIETQAIAALPVPEPDALARAALVFGGALLLARSSRSRTRD